MVPPTHVLLTDRTTISEKKPRSGHKLLKTLNGYSKEEVDEAIVTTWNKHLRNTSVDSSWVVSNENLLPPGISRRDARKMLLTGQSFLGSFMFNVVLPGFPCHTQTGQSYSAIILTVLFQADQTVDHKGLWFQADQTLDIYGPVYDTPCSIKKQSLWFQPDHILGHIWFSL